MIRRKEIDEYISLVESGVVVASNDVKLLIENVVKPILSEEGVWLDEETYEACLEYTSKYYYGYLPYQKFLAAFHFVYYPDGSLCFTEYFYMMGRGNGKDGFIAPLVNFFQTKKFGVQKYHIDIVATSEDQAAGTFELVYDMIKEGHHKANLKKAFYVNKEEIKHRKTLSRIKFNTSNSKTKDGKRPGCVVFNEKHAYEDTKNIDVHTSGMGKVAKGRIITITTQGHFRDGPLDWDLNICEMKLRGELPNKRLFPFICRLDHEDEAMMPEMYEKANPSINYPAFTELKREILDFYNDMVMKIASPSAVVEFYVKRMNLIKQDETACVATWENIQAANRDIPYDEIEGKSCVAGIDYADIQDFASAGLLFEHNGESIWLTHSWYCKYSPSRAFIKFPIEERAALGELTIIDAPTIDSDVVVGWVVDMAQKYNILAIACDTFRYQLLKKSFEKYGIYPKSKDHPDGLLGLVNSGPYTHGKISPVIENKFINKLYVWGKNRLMNWFTNNTASKQDAKGNKTFIKISPLTRKNDGFMALVHAETQFDLLENSNQELVFYDVIG